jgi:hypothetical protein
VTTSTEYYIYDFTAVVASIGGGIGMFLGFSCFGVASKAVSALYEYLSRSK